MAKNQQFEQRLKEQKAAQQRQQFKNAAKKAATPSPSVPKQKKQKGSDKVTLNKWVLFSAPFVFFLLFAAAAYYMLAVRNEDYLFAVQEHNMWLDIPQFFHDKMAFAGGFSQWLGCYFTQFFYYPALGSLILILWWAVLYAVTIRAFRIRPEWSFLALLPVVALLCSEIDLGYWLYYQKMPGYYFTQTISITFMMLGVWGFTARPRWAQCPCLTKQSWWTIFSSVWKPVYVILWTLLVYPLIGVWALIGMWMMVAVAVGRGVIGLDIRKMSFAGATAIAGIAAYFIIPNYYYYNVYSRLRIEDAWHVNFPLFQNDKLVSEGLVTPFYALIIVLAAFALFLALKDTVVYFMKKGKAPSCESTSRPSLTVSPIAISEWAVALILATVLMYFSVSESEYDNYNFHAELRIHRAIDECRWEDVLDECAAAPGPTTRQMVMSKNIALMNTGEIGDKMFHYDNSGEPPYAPDSLLVHTAQTAATQIYYNYGKMNFACRWAIEDGVEFGFDVDDMKTLVRTAMFSGEENVARKYIDILMHTTFYKDWAAERLAMIKDKKLWYASPEYKAIQPLRGFNDILDGDQGLCEMYLINYFSNMHSTEPKFQEETLVFALIQKDIAVFWPRFYNYASLHEKENMPIHYQEAAYLYGHLEDKVDISNMPFDKEKIVKRYDEFQNRTQSLLRNGLTSEEVGEAVKSEFGDTFWWFYFFCTNIHTY